VKKLKYRIHEAISTEWLTSLSTSIKLKYCVIKRISHYYITDKQINKGCSIEFLSARTILIVCIQRKWFPPSKKKCKIHTNDWNSFGISIGGWAGDFNIQRTNFCRITTCNERCINRVHLTFSLYTNCQNRPCEILFITQYLNFILVDNEVSHSVEITSWIRYLSFFTV
jgi:hypothetical protein